MRAPRRPSAGICCPLLALLLVTLASTAARAVPSPALPPEVTPVPVQDVLAVTPEMREWARREIPSNGSATQRLDLLVRRLQASDGAGLVYDPWFTAGAAETFAAKRFNCLAFSHLVVAMARELGLKAYYLEARGSERYARDGDLLLLAGHVTVGWGEGPQRWAIEFGSEKGLDPHRLHPIDDRRALALHYANLGAAALRNGDGLAALGELATAVQVDEQAGAAWVNLGVALRRRGQVEEAEKAYRHAIQVEPEVLPGWANLYALLRSVGRDRDAASLLADVASRPHADPWLLLALGDGCLETGDVKGARRLYEQAHDIAPEEAAPNAALASWAVRAGDTRRALRFLHRAEAIDPHEPRLIPVRIALKLPPPSIASGAG